MVRIDAYDWRRTSWKYKRWGDEWENLKKWKHYSWAEPLSSACDWELPVKVDVKTFRMNRDADLSLCGRMVQYTYVKTRIYENCNSRSGKCYLVRRKKFWDTPQGACGNDECGGPRYIVEVPPKYKLYFGKKVLTNYEICPWRSTGLPGVSQMSEAEFDAYWDDRCPMGWEDYIDDGKQRSDYTTNTHLVNCQNRQCSHKRQGCKPNKFIWGY